MRLAWLRADPPSATHLLDDTAALLDVLRLTHDVELFTADTAQDFAAQHERRPFDVPVYELDRTPAHDRLLSILMRYGGAVMLRTLALPDLRAAVQAARVTVVPYLRVAEDLRELYPSSLVRVAAVGVPATPGMPEAQHHRHAPVVFGTLSADRPGLLPRVFESAGLGPDRAVLLAHRSPQQVLDEADVIVSMPWPWFAEPPTETLAGLAAGKPVVTLETVGTADWPTLNPQTWQPRGPTTTPPIAVSIDPLDEEHSLVLAVARLSTDDALRTQLGRAAKDWWRTYATPEHAAADWAQILSEAAQAQTTSTTKV